MEKLAILGGEPAIKKPFVRWPQWGEREMERLREALDSGYWGLYSKVIQEWECKFAGLQGVRYASSVANGTVSLVASLRALGVGHGDEVIIPPYTFSATAGAVLWTGAIPVFADIDLGSFNLDPDSVREHVTPKTRAIVPVHIAGCPADMTEFRRIAEEHQLGLVEDAAQAIGAVWEGQAIGGIGDYGSFSCQSSKNLPCGEGGMVTTNDPDLWDRFERVKNCGRAPHGSESSYQTIGTNIRMSAFQAAVLLGQTEKFSEEFSQREKNWAHLKESLAEVPGMELQARDPRVEKHALHLLILRYDAEAFGGVPRSLFLEALAAEGVEAPHGGYQPIYKDPGFLADIPRFLRNLHVPHYADIHLPNTEKVCSEISVWIRQNALLGETPEQVEGVAQAVKKIHEQASALKSAKM
jgi:dTDP-4-amino-4,6-dideoxygalactose transaminase